MSAALLSQVGWDPFNPQHNQGRRANEHPPAKPPTRKLEIIRTQASDAHALCTSCKKKPGIYTCSQCYAVKFCSKDCQKDMWLNHKKLCKTVSKLVLGVTAATVGLVCEYGSEEAFLESDKVRSGAWDWPNTDDPDLPHPLSLNTTDRYIRMRQSLMLAYSEMGEQSLSPIAFRLAAENALDLLCMTYKNAYGEAMHKKIGGWLIAAGMDQEALDYMVYIGKRRTLKERIPYLDTDVCGDADIEQMETLSVFLEQHPKDEAAYSWFHWFMMGALLKYKNLQRRIMQKKISQTKFMTFMMGLHERAGAESKVKWFKGSYQILQKIQSYVCVDKMSDDMMNDDILRDCLPFKMLRVLSTEPKVINTCLKMVNERNEWLIPGLLDPNSIPGKPMSSYHDLLSMDWNDPHCEDPQNARHAVNNYACAYKMSPTYQKVLTNFLKTGTCTGRGHICYAKPPAKCVPKCRRQCHPWEVPMEGFFQCAVDVDPTKAFGDCSEFNLFCHKTKTPSHTCKGGD